MGDEGARALSIRRTATRSIRRSRRSYLLLPVLIVTLGFFGAAIVLVAISSVRPPGSQTLSHGGTWTLDAYRSLAQRPDLVDGIALSFRVAAASTTLAAILGLLVALAFRGSGPGWRTALQSSLPIPYVVAALALSWTLSPSGMVSRVLYSVGLLNERGNFPVLVQDRWGWGIVLAYAWKATPFVAMVLIASLDALDDRLESAARTLGAGRWLRMKTILLPHLRPSLLATSALVFAFTFGAFEVPLILGVRAPAALPLMAHRLYVHPDLARRPQAFALALIVTAASLFMIGSAYSVWRGRGWKRSGRTLSARSS